LGKLVRFPELNIPKGGTTLGNYPHNALTAAKIRNLEPGFHADGNCLYLIVEESGTAHWIVRTTINGKRRDVGVGGLQYVSLAEAAFIAPHALPKLRWASGWGFA
jgi:hypothetical protein